MLDLDDADSLLDLAQFLKFATYFTFFPRHSHPLFFSLDLLFGVIHYPHSSLANDKLNQLLEVKPSRLSSGPSAIIKSPIGLGAARLAAIPSAQHQHRQRNEKKNRQR